jgi:hypothetical protein
MRDSGLTCRPHSKRGSSGGVVTTVAFVVLVLACGGLSLAFMSARSHLHDMAIHYEALQEELTFNKNHLHHVEASDCCYCCLC